jgi:hypothetical protein
MNNGERVIAAFDAGAAGVVQLDGIMLGCAAPHTGTPHHGGIPTPLILIKSHGTPLQTNLLQDSHTRHDCADVPCTFARIDEGRRPHAVS